MDAKFKHLDYIQAAIARMATNSFLFKGWAITLASGLSGFGLATEKATLLGIGVATILLFWALDGYYLWLERGFVRLYRDVAEKTSADIDFTMQIDKTNAFKCWLRTCVRHHLVAFYGTMLILITLAGFFVEEA